MGGEGGKEQRAVGEVQVVGVAGDIKIVSQVYLHFFFFIIYVSTLKTFLLSLSSIHRTNMLFYLKWGCKRGENCPFSHKLKLMSLIPLYNFIANISFRLLFVNYFIFSSREREEMEEEGEEAGGGTQRES